MTIYIGADHRGFSLKQDMLSQLHQQHPDYPIIDCGNSQLEPLDDYPDFAFKVAEQVVKDAGGDSQGQNADSLGIIFCGSGVGATIAANKVHGARCCVGFSFEQVQAGRHDDDMNVLTIPADFTSVDVAGQLIKAFITTPFSREERYLRRIQKITKKESA